MEIVTRHIHPAKGWEKLADPEGVRLGIHSFEPESVEECEFNQATAHEHIADAVRLVHQAVKTVLHAKPYEDGALAPIYLGRTPEGLHVNRRAIPVPPWKACVEAGVHGSAWPDVTRLFVNIGCRIVKPGASMPAFPGGREWRKALARDTNLAPALLTFGFDRFEGRHLCASMVYTNDANEVIAYVDVPEACRLELQEEFEELMDTTDWRTGPTFQGQRTINRMNGVNTP